MDEVHTQKQVRKIVCPGMLVSINAYENDLCDDSLYVLMYTLKVRSMAMVILLSGLELPDALPRLAFPLTNCCYQVAPCGSI